MNVCAVYEFWVYGKAQNLCVLAKVSAMLFILMSILLLYSAGSGGNRVQVVLSRFSVSLFCFVQVKLYVGMNVCISWLHSCLYV